MVSQLVFATCMVVALPDNEPVLNRPVPVRVADADFSAALSTKISASWRNVELRTILNRLSNEQQVAVLLDRSIDPNQVLDLDLNYQSLLSGLGRVANTISAELCQLGNIVYIGPPKRVAKLRTLEHLRAKELSEITGRLPLARKSALAKSETLHWNDLDEPREIANLFALQAGVTITNPATIPHDLWATATLPRATVSEALSLILIQFDLTLTWNNEATEIRLVPVPEFVLVEKAHTPAGGPSKRASRANWERFLQKIANNWEQQLPGTIAKLDLENHQILLSATLEQHERLMGENPKPGAVANDIPLIEKRQFTLRIERVPAKSLMKKLEESGIKFAYDADQLVARNINLDDPISMDVKKADAEAFFHALCDPLGLKFQIDKVTVTLTPK